MDNGQERAYNDRTRTAVSLKYDRGRTENPPGGGLYGYTIMYQEIARTAIYSVFSLEVGSSLMRTILGLGPSSALLQY